MSTYNKIKNISIAVVAIATGFIACNKAPEPPIPNTPPTQDTTPTLATFLNDPEYTILKTAVTKAGLLKTLGTPTLRFTVFAPDNNAFIASGIPNEAAINGIDVATVTALVKYHVLPQVVTSTNIPGSFPNFQYPTILNPAPQFSALLRLTTFPSKRGNAAWVNNIPVTEVDRQAVNGVLHKVARVVAPPSQYLWDRINTDTDLEYLKAAIIRADSGTTGTLQSALQNIGANLTVFAPTDDAFIALLTAAITQALIDKGVQLPDAFIQAQALASTPDVFSNPALFADLPAEKVKGIVVYHILGSRAFSVNIPSTETSVPTLLNGAIPAHPGIRIKADFAGPIVTAATVKGAANANASNITINPLPNGSSDQHYFNGVIHKIDQVLLPQ